MRPWILLALLAGCSRADRSAQVGPQALAIAELEILKHFRDAQRFENARMPERAEQEYWLAGLKAFGLQDAAFRQLAVRAYERRLTLRAGGCAAPVEFGRGPICILRVPPEEVEITRHVRDGERAAADGRNADADRDFSAAEERIRGLSVAPKAMLDLLPLIQQARGRLWECRSP